MTLGMLLNFSESQLPLCKMGIMIPPLKALVRIMFGGAFKASGFVRAI